MRYVYSRGGWIIAFIVAMILIIVLALLAINRIPTTSGLPTAFPTVTITVSGQ
ncbi:MAG TPA: hypothetical protein VHD90_25545 [Phototrophicaceae bacterium]|nr:hypothetical protein [Phototrophicaceae bacterium]